MTAIGELVRALFEAAAADGAPWTDGYKPNIIYIVDESQFESEDFTNNSKLFIYPLIEPWGKTEHPAQDGYKGAKHTVHFLLERNDGDDDKLQTQLLDMIAILKGGTCTGMDDNEMTEHSEVISASLAGTASSRKVMAQGEIVVEDRVA